MSAEGPSFFELHFKATQAFALILFTRKGCWFQVCKMDVADFGTVVALPAEPEC